MFASRALSPQRFIWKFLNAFPTPLSPLFSSDDSSHRNITAPIPRPFSYFLKLSGFVESPTRPYLGKLSARQQPFSQGLIERRANVQVRSIGGTQ